MRRQEFETPDQSGDLGAEAAFPSARQIPDEIQEFLQRNAGIVELWVDADYRWKMKFIGNGSGVESQTRLLPAIPERLDRPTLNGPLFYDPDIHRVDHSGEYSEVSVQSQLKLMRQEYLPWLVASGMYRTGRVIDRGSSGFDLLCKHGEGETAQLEQVQIKLVPENSPLLDPKKPEKFLSLVSILKPHAEDEILHKVLLVQDGASDESLIELREKLLSMGVVEDQIEILSDKEMVLFGIELPTVSGSPRSAEEQETLLCRIDLAKQDRAFLADRWLRSSGRKKLEEIKRELRRQYNASRTNHETEDRPIPFAIKDPMLARLQREGIIELADELEQIRECFPTSERKLPEAPAGGFEEI